MLADGLRVLGPANWSVHGLDIKHELDVSTANLLAIASFADQFDQDWRPTG